MLKKIKLFYKAHFIGFETILPIVLTFILFCVFRFFKIEDRIVSVVFEHDDFNSFILMLIQSYLSLIGFVMAVMAILTSLESSKRLDYIKKSPQYSKAFKIFYSALIYLGISVIFHSFLFFVKIYPLASFYVMLSLFLILVFKLLRCLWLLKVFINLSSDKT